MINEILAKSYCCEDISQIENYNKALNDKSQVYNIHHRLETEKNLSCKQLKEQNRYYKVPACELIFLTKAEHNQIHFRGIKRGPRDEETKKKLSIALKGKEGNNKGKIFSSEWCEHLSKSHKGKSNGSLPTEAKKKISDSLKGHIVSNETRYKISQSIKGKHRVYDDETKTSYHYE